MTFHISMLQPLLIGTSVCGSGGYLLSHGFEHTGWAFLLIGGALITACAVLVVGTRANS